MLCIFPIIYNVPLEKWAGAKSERVPLESANWVEYEMKMNDFKAEFIGHFLSSSERTRVKDEYAFFAQGEKRSGQGSKVINR